MGVQIYRNCKQSLNRSWGWGYSAVVTGCGDKSGGPWACGSFDKQLAARVP